MSVSTRSFTINTAVRLVTEECYSCGVTFAMPDDFQATRRQDRGTFYCPNGHGQHYTGKTDAERERERAEQLAKEKERIEADRAYYQKQLRLEREEHKTTQRRLNGTKGALKATQNRVKNGVCPVPQCKRHFKNVEQHVKKMHPDYAAPKADEE